MKECFQKYQLYYCVKKVHARPFKRLSAYFRVEKSIHHLSFYLKHFLRACYFFLICQTQIDFPSHFNQLFCCPWSINLNLFYTSSLMCFQFLFRFLKHKILVFRHLWFYIYSFVEIKNGNIYQMYFVQACWNDILQYICWINNFVYTQWCVFPLGCFNNHICNLS